MQYIAICDDNSAELLEERKLVDEFIASHPCFELAAISFERPEKFLSAIADGCKFAVCLLDIMMPGTDGIELGRALRTAGCSSKIIYLSASRDHALEAFGVQATQYLIKPVCKSALFDSLCEALLAHSAEYAACFAVRTDSGLVRVRLCDVSYVECVCHVRHIHLIDGSQIVANCSRDSFEKDMEPLLCDERFISIHRSYIINFSQVVRISTGTVILIGDKELPIARARYAAVKERYLDFLAKRGDSGSVF